jgi:hypothetical protein
MRENITVGVIVGLFFFMATAVVTAIAIKYATPSLLWDIILWGGVTGMLCSVLTLVLFVSAQLSGRPFLWPALLINFGLCLGAAGIVWHFSPAVRRSGIDMPLGTLSFVEMSTRFVRKADGLTNIELYANYYNQSEHRLKYTISSGGTLNKPRFFFYPVFLLQDPVDLFPHRDAKILVGRFDNIELKFPIDANFWYDIRYFPRGFK